MATPHCFCTCTHQFRLQLFLSGFFLSSQHSSYFDPSVFILLSWPASLPPLPSFPSIPSLPLSLVFLHSFPFLLLLPFTHPFIIKLRGFGGLRALCPQTQLTPRIFSLCWIVPQNERQLNELALSLHVCKRRLGLSEIAGGASREVPLPHMKINMLTQLS